MKMSRKPTSVLALSIEPNGLTLCRVRLRGDRPETAGRWRLPVPGDLLRIDPAQAGAEIRRHLAQVRVRREPCLVSIPPAWAFSFPLEVPEDAAVTAFPAFLEAEVEHRCPVGLADLSYTVLPSSTPQPGEELFVAGVPLEHVTALESALRTGGLRPVSMTLQGASLIETTPDLEGLALIAGPASADLAVVEGGRIRVLRSLLWSGGGESAEEAFDAREIVRQMRLTLGQIPVEKRSRLSGVRAYGLETLSEEARADLAAGLARLGLTPNEQASSDDVPADLLARARLFLEGKRPRIELQPRRVSRLQHAALRFSARRTRLVVGAALLVVVLAGAALVLQHRRLSALEARWSEIEPQATAVRQLQDQVRRYRSWYDGGLPSLTMAKRLTEAFPEEGTVWVRALQFKDRATVTCTGNARTRADWMAVLEKLRNTEGIENVQVVSTRGDAPLVFTMTLRWNRSDGSGQ